MEIKVDLAFEKETKGAVRYMEVGSDGAAKSLTGDYVVGTLYIRKAVLKGVTPQKLQLTING